MSGSSGPEPTITSVELGGISGTVTVSTDSFSFDITDSTGDQTIDWLSGPVTVFNFGTIEATGDGVVISGTVGTVVNAGTIIGASGTAVSLDAASGGVVVVNPGAVFQGTVSGGSSAVGTLELAAAAGDGTLTGLNSQFINFATVAVDPGASWSLSGNNTIAAGVTVMNAGSLTFSGTVAVAGMLTGTGETAISFSDDNGLLVIQQGATVQGAIGGFRAGDLIQLPGVAVTEATLGAGNVLSLQESGGSILTLNLAPDQDYSGYVFTASSLGSDGTGIGAVLASGPTAGNGATTLGHNQNVDLTSLIRGLITPGLAGDTETVTTVSALFGSASVTNGVISYMAPSSGLDTLNYTVADQNGSTASGTVNVTVDPGPTAGTGAVTLGHGNTANLTSLVAGLVTPGLAGDSETLNNVSAAHGSASLVGGVVSYTAPAAGPDSLTYTVADQYGDTASGIVSVTVDPGPTAGTGAVTLGHDATADLTSLIGGLVTPGLIGDSETLTSVSAAHGSASLVGGVVSYTAQASGADTISYTMADQYGDTASGAVNVTVDPGPTAGTGAVTLGHGNTADLTSLIGGLVTPGLIGDSETLTSVSAAHGSASLSGGVVSYTAPAAGPDSLTYTVADQYGDTASGAVNVTVDPGPIAGTGAVTFGHDATADLTSLIGGLVTPGLFGDSETLTSVSAAHGTASLVGRVVSYTAPAAGPDSLTYTVADQYGDTASGAVNVTVDPGPTAGTGAVTLGHGNTANLTNLIGGLVTPGLFGDSETLTSVSAAHGTASLVGRVVSYTAPAAGPDSLTYTVADQYGDTASGAVNVTVDPGPTAGTGAVTLGHGKTANLTNLIGGLVTPGLFGDSETLTSVSAAHGSASLSGGVVSYTAPAAGPDSLTYTVADQYGDTASGIVSVTVDPGPRAGAAPITLAVGQSIDLTSYLLGLDTPGIVGDVLTLTGANTAGTHGSVTLSNGDLSYTARGTAGSDSFGYIVSDPYGDSASATVSVTVVSSLNNIGNANGTIILGNASSSFRFGNGTVTVVAGNGNDQISGGNGNDTVQLGNGNDTVRLGNGNDTVRLGNGNDTVTGGNGNDTVQLGNGNNTVRLGNGSNIITLGTGSNNVTVGNQNNTITFIGSASSRETISAGNGNDTLNLGAGTYDVAVGNGSDTFILGDGTYHITVGHGTPDLFIYTVPSGLLDMSFGGSDELVFRNSGFDLGADNGHGTTMPQAIAAALFSSRTDGTFATPGDRFAYNTANGNLYYDAAGSTAGSSRELVAELTNMPHLSAANLFFTS